MKITSNTPAPKPNSSVAQRGSVSGRAAPASGSGSAPSADATRLSQLEAQLAPSDFSATKVNEITAAIAAGRYQVNAGAVADKLLASTAELARKPGR